MYERLDELGADTAEAKASHLLKGLGFDTKMQNKKCKDYSGGWRMRIGKQYSILSSIYHWEIGVLQITPCVPYTFSVNENYCVLQLLLALFSSNPIYYFWMSLQIIWTWKHVFGSRRN